MAYEMFSYKIKMSLLDSNCFRLYFIEPEIILKFSSIILNKQDVDNKI